MQRVFHITALDCQLPISSLHAASTPEHPTRNSSTRSLFLNVISASSRRAGAFEIDFLCSVSQSALQKRKSGRVLSDSPGFRFPGRHSLESSARICGTVCLNVPKRIRLLFDRRTILLFSRILRAMQPEPSPDGNTGGTRSIPFSPTSFTVSPTRFTFDSFVFEPSRRCSHSIPFFDYRQVEQTVHVFTMCHVRALAFCL